tara:strand:- start:16544 stop:17815 length:1272 start_codon:yes stop_codon:yes gene_type:complete
MHNRQTGAAHVPIMFFLILLVMFLGALGFAYVQQTRNAEVLKARDTAIEEANVLKQKELLITHYIEDIGKVVNKPGKYLGRDNSANLYKGAVLTYDGVINPKDLEQVMTEASTNAGVSAASGLDNLLGSMIAKINTQEQRIKDVAIEKDKALADKESGDSRFTTVSTQAQTTASETSTNLDQAVADFESAKSDRDRRITALQNNLKSKVDELTTHKEEALAREKALNGRIGLLQTQLSAMSEKMAMRQPPNVADGKVLVAKNGIPTAFINLGRKDLLQPGTVFRIKSANGGEVKGYCEVTRIEDERAEVRLYNFSDPVANYATEGDLIFNDLYTPRVTRTMYLMGRFSAPYQKEQLTNLLRRLGNRVVTKMGPGVDTVLLGNNPVNEAGDGFATVQDSPEFKLANELRVEFTYLSKIADLIKL